MKHKTQSLRQPTWHKLAGALHEDCGYPSTVCLADGTIVTLAYTVFDLDHPDWGTCCIAYRYPQELLTYNVHRAI